MRALSTRALPVVVVVTLVASLVGFTTPAAAIWGDPAEVDLSVAENPDWHVQIDTGPGYCSGILIDHEWVLTARHCQEPPAGMEVYIAAADGRIEHHSVSAFIPMPGQSASTDIGLIRLRTAARSTIQLAELSRHGIGTPVETYGFGWTYDPTAEDPQLLQGFFAPNSFDGTIEGFCGGALCIGPATSSMQALATTLSMANGAKTPSTAAQDTTSSVDKAATTRSEAKPETTP